MEPRSIKLLTNEGDVPLAARVVEQDGRRLTLHLDRRLEGDAAVRIDVDDQVLLGEVRSCVRTADGFWAGIELNQAITSVHDLTRLVNALMARGTTRDDGRKEACERTVT
jgi:hypothetical protein